MQPVVPPKLIRDNGDKGKWTACFKQDDQFGQPKACVVFQLMTNKVHASAMSAVLAQLYQTCCAANHLEECACLTCDVQLFPCGV